MRGKTQGGMVWGRGPWFLSCKYSDLKNRSKRISWEIGVSRNWFFFPSDNISFPTDYFYADFGVSEEMTNLVGTRLDLTTNLEGAKGVIVLSPRLLGRDEQLPWQKEPAQAMILWTFLKSQLAHFNPSNTAALSISCASPCWILSPCFGFCAQWLTENSWAPWRLHSVVVNHLSAQHHVVLTLPEPQQSPAMK